MAQKPKGYDKHNKQDPRVTDRFIFFHMSWPSQWHKAPMRIDNVEYNCCEQFMMAQKAILFNDNKSLQLIMNTANPSEQKAIGRKVKNFKPKIWDKHKTQIIYNGNYAKFTQNKKLFKLLLSYSSDKIFVEASKSDRIYGIGLGVNDRKADNPSNWKGQNLLGQIITQVRDTIIDQMQASNDSGNQSNVEQSDPINDVTFV